MAEQETSGCLKAFLSFVAIVLILLLFGAYYVWTNLDKFGNFARQKTAEAVESSMMSVLKDLEYPEQEISEVMVPIKAFTDKIRDNEITMEQGMGVFQHLVQGPVLTSVMLKSFAVKFVDQSETLSEQQKEEARIDISRFIYGISEDTIPFAKTEEILQLLQEETSEEDGTTRKKQKKTLTAQEVEQCLSLIREAADKAEIDKKEFPFNLAKEVEEAIRIGIEAGFTPEPESIR